MKQWLVFLPINYNDGSIVSENTLRELEGLLSEEFGVATAYPKASGMWINGKSKLVRDKVKVIQIITPSGKKTDVFIREFGKKIRDVLNQELVLMVSFPIETLEISE